MSPQIIIDHERQRLLEKATDAAECGFVYLRHALRSYRAGRPIQGDIAAHEARNWYIHAAHLGRILQRRGK